MQSSYQTEILELVPLGVRDITGLLEAVLRGQLDLGLPVLEVLLAHPGLELLLLRHAVDELD